MIKTRTIALALGILALPLLAAKDAETVLQVAPDGASRGTMREAPARFLVTADSLAYPLLSPEFAAANGFRTGMFKPKAKIGRVALTGGTGVTDFTLEGVADKRRVMWFDRPFEPGYDVVVGPESAPQSRVVFPLAAAAAGTREYRLPLVHALGRTGTMITVGGSDVFVQWNLRSKRTLASAAAASAIAAAHGGEFHGQPGTRTIAFGIERPVRPMRLATLLAIGPTRLADLDVRTADFGSVAGIADAEVEADPDPNEIVVTGKAKKSKAVYVVTIGTDDLSGCSSLTFDKAAKTIVLRCAG